MSEAAGTKQWVKHLLKEKLIRLRQRKYHKQLENKEVTYDVWITKQERRIREEIQESTAVDLIIKKIPYEACESYLSGISLGEEKADVILFLDSDGKEAEWAEYFIHDYMFLHPETELVYADEDVRSPDGIRCMPWLKPDWSPDTFLSNFYFGSIFAVRTHTLQKISKEKINMLWNSTKEDCRIGIYRLCFELAKISSGFEKRTDSMLSMEGFPIGHIDEVLYHSYYNKEMNLLLNNNILEDKEMPESEEGNKTSPFISIIIPSKDNEEVLKRCMESILRTASMDYEIIVVDNGSIEETRLRLSHYLNNKKGIYLYEKMPFHFSKMCNIGAAAARGDVLLFLNDDVEIPITQKGWMKQVYRQAVKPYSGAVGVKLYYPKTDTIQHAGIVNHRLGPVHKLQFKEDNISYYFSWNRGKRNVIAVTGACLAVDKKKFLQTEGFPEELPVAFNDVDLCFSMYEKGYYNTIMQDITFYHYESLSRGQDEEKEKLERLLMEKNKLYKRHPALYGRDPFYHKYLAGDLLSSGFDLRSDYEYTEQKAVGSVTCRSDLLKKAREDACVMSSIEYAGDLEEWKAPDAGTKECHEDAEYYYIQGYVFVSGSDNACYEKKILLQSKERLLLVKPESLIRKDVEQNLPDQVNVGLAGFRVKIRRKDMMSGHYRIGILMEDRCSGQKLYSWTNRYLGAKTDKEVKRNAG